MRRFPNAMRSKYGAVRTGKYASQKESKRAGELKIMESLGLISGLREQVRYELTPKIGKERASHYIADFVYIEKGIGEVIEDCKGYRTSDYVLKRKFMLYRYGISIRET